MRRYQNCYVLRADIMLLPRQQLQHAVNHSRLGWLRPICLEHPERRGIVDSVLLEGLPFRVGQQIFRVVDSRIAKRVAARIVPEKEIDGIYHVGRRAEVLVEMERHRRHVGAIGRAAVGVDVRAAKCVDGLLRVAHEENRGTRPVGGVKKCNPEYVELHRVGILELVHKHSLVFLTKLRGKERACFFVVESILQPREESVECLLFA